jgi:hypothetical protein
MRRYPAWHLGQMTSDFFMLWQTIIPLPVILRGVVHFQNMPLQEASNQAHLLFLTRESDYQPVTVPKLDVMIAG